MLANIGKVEAFALAHDQVGMNNVHALHCVGCRPCASTHNISWYEMASHCWKQFLDS
jgi:hypothetical protein